MSDLSALKGVGPRVIERLDKLKIHTITDLLFHLPIRYQDRTKVTPINRVQVGRDGLVCVEVLSSTVVYRRRRMLLVHVTDGSGVMQLRFFHFNRSQQSSFQEGARLACYGEVHWVGKSLEMVHPEYRIIQLDDDPTEQRLTPVYSVAEGVQQKTLKRLTEQALAWVRKHPEVTQDVLQGLQHDKIEHTTLDEALEYLHRPPADADVEALLCEQHPLQRRMALDELLARQVAMLQLRRKHQAQQAISLTGADSLRKGLLANLSFELTAAQKRVLEQVTKDLTQDHPMLRLVQGDVGSGKTIVALLACLQAVDSGCQAAIMAPTEILAEQHYRTVSQLLLPLGVQVAWLASSLNARQRNEALALIQSGTAQVVVGTHALFQESVDFHRLALSVIDEQHRFGVHQRLSLRAKGEKESQVPHQLIMTATPIPRTLAMTAYADLDYSVIDELPPGRKPITTVAISEQRRADIIARINQACAEGKQAYWVCPLIEESEALQCQAATDTYTLLQDSLPSVRVGLIHGRMKSSEKEQVMHDFCAHQIDLLVATTVIEVGVDVANASLMIIENAERLGLAQLHQLRGRVGRGDIQSNCVLLYKTPLSELASTRIEAMRNTTDGFELAKTDMEIRGPGEMLGTRQAGGVQLRIADYRRDKDLLPVAQHAAKWLLEKHPERVPCLISRWLGNATDYLNA